MLSLALAGAAAAFLTVAMVARADDTACVGKVPAIHVLTEPLSSTNDMNAVRGEFWSFQNYGENDRCAGACSTRCASRSCCRSCFRASRRG